MRKTTSKQLSKPTRIPHQDVKLEPHEERVAVEAGEAIPEREGRELPPHNARHRTPNTRIQYRDKAGQRIDNRHAPLLENQATARREPIRKFRPR